MKVLRNASFPQRVVLSVGLGFALAVTAGWWLLGDAYRSSGWFAYAPATSADAYLAIPDRQALHLFVALAAVALWTVSSFALFGLRAEKRRADVDT